MGSIEKMHDLPDEGRVFFIFDTVGRYGMIVISNTLDWEYYTTVIPEPWSET